MHHQLFAIINHLYIVLVNAWLITPRHGAWTLGKDNQLEEVKG